MSVDAMTISGRTFCAFGRIRSVVLDLSAYALVILATMSLSSVAGESLGKQRVTVALIQPLSTSSKLFGIPIKRGFLLALEEEFDRYVDTETEIRYRLEEPRAELIIKVFDDSSDAMIARRIASNLASDQTMLVVVGSGNSICTAEVIDVGLESGFAVISPISAASRLSSDRTAGTFFRLQVEDSRKMDIVAKELVHTQGVERVAVFYENDPWYGNGLRDDLIVALKRLNHLGYREFSYDRDTTSDAIESSHGLDVGQFAPDGAALLGLDPDVVTISEYLSAAGLDIPVYFTGDSEDYLSSIPLSNATGVGMVYFRDSPRIVIKEFNRKYLQRYGDTPGSSAAHGYDTGKVVSLAIKESLMSLGFASLDSRTRRERFREKLALTDHHGILGRTAFTSLGNPAHYELNLIPIKTKKVYPWLLILVVITAVVLIGTGLVKYRPNFVYTVLVVLEALTFTAAIVLAAVWLLVPNTSLEPEIVLCTLLWSGVDFVRRQVRPHPDSDDRINVREVDA